MTPLGFFAVCHVAEKDLAEKSANQQASLLLSVVAARTVKEERCGGTVLTWQRGERRHNATLRSTRASTQKAIRIEKSPFLLLFLCCCNRGQPQQSLLQIESKSVQGTHIQPQSICVCASRLHGIAEGNTERLTTPHSRAHSQRLSACLLLFQIQPNSSPLPKKAVHFPLPCLTLKNGTPRERR